MYKKDFGKKLSGMSCNSNMLDSFTKLVHEKCFPTSKNINETLLKLLHFSGGI